MNKAEFINAVSEAAGSSKSDATAHVEAMISVVTGALRVITKSLLLVLELLKQKNVKQEQEEILEQENPFKLQLQ